MNLQALTAIAVMMACQTVGAQSPATPVLSGSSRIVVGIQRAAWLQGCWAWTTPGRRVEETWTTPKGGSMTGASTTIRDGQVTASETIVLREDGDRLAYEAHPSGQPAATFLSTRIGASEIVFENPAHDFPQEIGYRLEGDALFAWIRGTQSGQERRIEFPYRRARCIGK